MKYLPAGELLSRKETAQKAFISRISAIPCCHRHDSRESDCNEPKKPKTENAQATTINKKKKQQGFTDALFALIVAIAVCTN